MRITFSATKADTLLDAASNQLAYFQREYDVALTKERHEKQYRIDEYDKRGFFEKWSYQDPRTPSIFHSQLLRIHSESIKFGGKINELKSIIKTLSSIHYSGAKEIVLTDKEVDLLNLGAE
jgi:hypothetical protein